MGTLNIHTTHTIARYLLPKSVTYFTKKYPKISFHLHPVMSASKEQISKGYPISPSLPTRLASTRS